MFDIDHATKALLKRHFFYYSILFVTFVNMEIYVTIVVVNKCQIATKSRAADEPASY